MTDKEIVITIAETLGFKWSGYREEKDTIGWTLNGQYFPRLPDYLNDSNAARELEKVLVAMGPANLCFGHKSYVQKYVEELATLVENDFCHAYAPLRNCFAAIHASPRKKAEAFLKAVGKWKE